MNPDLRCFGVEQSPVVVIDEFSGDAGHIARIAEALGPFPTVSGDYYPGVRRFVGEDDAEAWDYVVETCERASPFVGGAFGLDGFTLGECSFSMVTIDPASLKAVQRAPHFDSPDPKHLAILHYLRVPSGIGTAFFRHRSTGIERVDEANVDSFINAAAADAAKLPPDSGYIQGSDAYYEQIGAVEAVADRLVIYQGCLLHSGIIPPGMNFSADPREGRLTANIFIRGA